jgi:putative transport protein
MALIGEFLASQPLLSLFLVIASGYAIGAINLRGLSLGVGAVLFTGLFLGALVPKAQPPALVGTLGLVLFLYGLGIQYGRQFVAGLAGRAGRRYNLLALVALMAATAAMLAVQRWLGLSTPLVAGLFAGSATNSPTLQAALEASGSIEPAVGYSITYPFGMVGPILCIYLVQSIVRPRSDAGARLGLQTLEVAVQSDAAVNSTIGDVLTELPPGVRILIVRAGQQNRLPVTDAIVSRGDVLLLASTDVASLETARKRLGERVHDRVVGDRRQMDLLRAFVSSPVLAGVAVGDLRLPAGVDASVAFVQRGDTEMLVAPDLVLEFGDRVGVLAARDAFPALRRFFGDSIRGTTEFSYAALGTGIVLGVLLGSISVPLPGLGSFKMGVTGGSLIAALVLGRLGRTGPLTWTMPLSANLTLRNFGLSVFLAQVGLASGAPFVDGVKAGGLSYLFAGMVILLALALTALLVGHFVMRIPFDDLLGITSGVTGTPAILAYAVRAYPSDRVEICYAMIFPAATIVKIVIVQVLIALARGG